MSLWEKIRKLIAIESGASHFEEANADEEKNELTRQIIEDVISNPGQMICVDDPNLVNEAKKVVNKLWARVGDKQMWEEIRYGQLGSEIQVSFSERARKLQPTFIARMPNQEVRAYYSEATAAWLRGLDCAALILCWSLIERMTRDALRGRRDVERGEGELARLLLAAKEIGALTEQGRRDADTVRELRNHAVHRLRPVTTEECYDAILGTKRVIEDLLSPKQTGR